MPGSEESYVPIRLGEEGENALEGFVRLEGLHVGVEFSCLNK